METVLPKLQNKIIVDEKGNNILPLLNLGTPTTVAP
jgi:membrane protease subunit HflK